MLTPKEAITYHGDPELGALLFDASIAGVTSELWTRLTLAVAARKAGTSLLAQTGTRRTTPAHIWHSLVVEFARVSDADARQFADDQLAYWGRQGMTVADAAVQLARAVSQGHSGVSAAERAAGLRRIIRDARR